jgi:hypothetical protein
MFKILIKQVITCFFLASVLLCHSQDTLYLATGDTIIGEITWQDNRKVIIVNDNGRHKFKSSEISQISIAIEPGPNRGDNAIVFQCALNGLDLMMAMGQSIKSMGYQFENVDKDFLSLRTEPIKKPGDIMVKLYLSVTDGIATLSGYAKAGKISSNILLGVADVDFVQVQYYPNRGATWKYVKEVEDKILEDCDCSSKTVKK